MTPHRHAIRVYYEDTDAAGIVYYANYLKFAERARTEMLREAGFDHRALLAERDLQFAVRRCSADYRAPARLDDLLEVRTTPKACRGARLMLEQAVCRDGQTLVLLEVELVLLRGSLRPCRIPDDLARGFLFQSEG